MKILITGGAGYIGSHMAKVLTKEQHEVIIFDNLSTGHASAAKYGKLIIGDLLNTNDLQDLFEKHHFHAVMHFAAKSIVSESISNPKKYFNSNVLGTVNLLDTMLSKQVNHLIFSSTAAIFGNPMYSPIDEKHPKNPINPYGKSKLIMENIIEYYCSSYNLNAVALRYFNAAGADPEGELGENHDPETHLIPLILQTASGRRDHITIFGTNYDTQDGSCVRDYIHVQDLCNAHLMALMHITNRNESGFNAFNLGNSVGHSVLEVIEQAKLIVGMDGLNIRTKYAEKRPGDPSSLIASNNKASLTLGWKPKLGHITNIIQDAWNREKLITKA